MKVHLSSRVESQSNKAQSNPLNICVETVLLLLSLVMLTAKGLLGDQVL